MHRGRVEADGAGRWNEGRRYAMSSGQSRARVSAGAGAFARTSTRGVSKIRFGAVRWSDDAPWLWSWIGMGWSLFRGSRGPLFWVPGGAVPGLGVCLVVSVCQSVLSGFGTASAASAGPSAAQARGVHHKRTDLMPRGEQIHYL